MEKKEKLVPKRRFKAFQNSSAWEERKLGDLAFYKKGPFGSALKKDIFVSKSSDSVKVYEQQNAIKKNCKLERYFITKAYANKLNAFKVRGGDIIVSCAGTIGEIYVLPSDAEDGIINQALMRIRVNEDLIDKTLFKYLFSNMIDIFSKIHSNGSAMKNIPPFADLKRMSVYVPPKHEQRKVVSLLTNINNLITLQQRKLEKTKALKDAYLSEMFPQEGESVPKRRFAGFTGAWEQRKLGDYAKYRRGSFPQPYGNEEWYNGEGAMPFVQVVDVTDRLELADNTKQKISKVAQPMSVFVPKGKVVVTLQGSIGRVAITQYESFIDRTILIFEDFNELTDKYFWAYTIQKKFDIEKQIAPGGTIKTITKEALSSFTIRKPQIDEQQKIGTFFSHLDDLITLQQRKLEKLQNIKKAYLNEMLI